jgi:PGF-CTERM protein
MSQYPGRNVIGIVTGTDPVLKDQFVALSAHNDHVGVVPADRGVEHDSLRAFNSVMRPQGANDRPGPPTVAQWSQINGLVARARSIRPARMDTVNNGADDDESTDPVPGFGIAAALTALLAVVALRRR